jgi:hypothetical protein
MNIFKKKLLILFLLFLATALVAEAQKISAVNDTLRTGPLQTVRKNIIHNDLVTNSSYSWRIITSPLPTCGTIVKSNDYLIFTPNFVCRGDTFDIQYELSNRHLKDTATVHIIVANNNKPVNIIDSDVACAEDMQEGITFGIRKKYEISPRAETDNWIDGLVSPLVGDLNGDGKPEIVIMGNSENHGAVAYTYMRYINIYNGQTGERICQHNFMNSEGYSEMSMGGNWHRPPSSLALADLDNDGIGEIIFCHSNSGQVAAFKPDFKTVPISLKLMWEGRTQLDEIVNYKSPISSTDDDIYGYPHPYIADLNADGTPEVIVYNKIFNGANGRLLMTWQNGASASNPKTSNYTSSSGLTTFEPNIPTDLSNATKIRDAAMTGRRPASTNDADRYLAVPTIVDIDGDGQQEIITGNRIHKFKFNSLNNHTKNTYYTIEGPQSAEISESNGNVTYGLSDGFTRVADIDGDGRLDIIVACFGNKGAGGDVKIVVYVWDTSDLNNVKACVSFRSNGDGYSNFSIPFIGDINGKLDGYDSTASKWSKKLPEICILSGNMFIDRKNSAFDRTGVMFHPKTDEVIRRGVGMDNNNASATNRRFNRAYSSASENVRGSLRGHIVGLTWDATANAIEEKLKVSWAMEHDDISANTGITLFDFNNDNAADLCYRDAWTLRVISPAKSGRDYVELSEDENSANTSIMFKTDVYSATAFEYPVIADVNMDGSADIVVTNSGVISRDVSRGWIEVYEYSGQRWASCPPVWNQGMYDPTQVREDLKINARPMSMLTPYVKNGDTIYPYNGSWIQVPIVKERADFVPVVRVPDAAVVNMTVSAENDVSATVTLTIRNDGSATINAQTPVTFYNGGVTGNPIGSKSPRITTLPVGMDIFPGEKVTRTFKINGDYRGLLIWARITDNGTNFPAPGYLECDTLDNAFSGSHCPELSATATASPANVISCSNAAVTLSAASNCSGSTTYQWYLYDNAIVGATSATYSAETPGEYKCYIHCGLVCRTFSPTINVTRNDLPNAQVVGKPVVKYDASTDSLHISVKAENVGDADFKSPFKITVYKNAKGNALKYTYSYPDVIAIGDTVEISFGIPNFNASWRNNAYTGLYLNLNDKGDTKNDQAICDSVNRAVMTGLTIAADDYITILQGSEKNVILVGVNDLLLCTVRDPKVKVDATGAPKHGSYNIRRDTIIYTPARDFIGRDTITYTIVCDGHPSIASVYMTVLNKPVIAGGDSKPVCPGDTLEFVSTYVTNCAVSDTVVYRWEFRHFDSAVWTTIKQESVKTPNCSTAATVKHKLQLAAVAESNEGYYRMWANYPKSAGGIGNGAVTDSVAVHIAKHTVAQDIRIDVCPMPLRTIRLTSFLDTLDNVTVTWEKVSRSAPYIDSTTGVINTANMAARGVYTYRYTAKSCIASSAIAYVRVANGRIIRRIDTIAVCKEYATSASINLNRILGVELGGAWSYDADSDPDEAVKNNVHTFPASSLYFGAMIFNGRKAWSDASNSAYNIQYKNNVSAKRFVFKYTPASNSCVGNPAKKIVIVITP